MDDLERAIETGGETDNLSVLLEGVKMIYKNLWLTLEREGVAKIEAVGKPFNSNIHEILVKVPTNEYLENTVIEESRKGYMFKGKVIRPSIVKIALREEGVKGK